MLYLFLVSMKKWFESVYKCKEIKFRVCFLAASISSLFAGQKVWKTWAVFLQKSFQNFVAPSEILLTLHTAPVAGKRSGYRWGRIIVTGTESRSCSSRQLQFYNWICGPLQLACTFATGLDLFWQMLDQKTLSNWTVLQRQRPMPNWSDIA